ncbi:hypothetical protein Btru_065441 [Bulinus truncatus]|nr:hypothetical protein Btru_065441 [Bulinus truncatus]
MGNKLSIETYQVKSASKGCTYRISLDSFSSQDHNHVTTYEGMTFFMKFREERVIAKFQKQPTTSSEKWSKTQVKMSQKASEIAEKFNGVLKDAEERSGRKIGEISFVEVLLPKIDEVAIFSNKRQEGEFYTCEPKFKVFKHFITANGVPMKRSKVRNCRRRSSSESCRSGSLSSTSSVGRAEKNVIPSRQRCVEPPPYISAHPPSYEQSQAEQEFKLRDKFHEISDLISYPEISHTRCDPQVRLWESAPEMGTPAMELQRSTSFSAGSSQEDLNNPVEGHALEAFVHYFYCHTNGQCVISNLKGEVDRKFRYNLTTPVFHSLSESFGERDRGEKGISLVIENHKCNSLCRNFVPMEELFERAAGRIV